MSNSNYIPKSGKAKNTGTVSKSSQMSLQQSYRGPVPLPEDLEKYENIQPGFADRLISLAEKEQDHRINITQCKLNEDVRLQDRDVNTFRIGQFMAILAVIIIVGLCCYFLYLGYASEARDVAIAVIIGLASLFLINKWKSKNT